MSPQFLVTDLERSIGFYSKHLGFAVEFRYEDFYAGIIKDGCSIHLKHGTPSRQERESKRINEGLDLIFSVDGIENMYKQLSQEPIEIIQPLRQMPYGKEFYIADPDGYLISFIEAS